MAARTVHGAPAQGARVGGALPPATSPRTAPPRGALPHTAPSKLDRLIHDHVRLGIVSALAANESLSFTQLRSALGASDGNLSVHARKLEDAGYVACTKKFSGRTPRTDYTLTATGRRALEKYLDHMDAIIKAARSSST
jgi:DNA-binding transcriptional ArsR family regulator